MAMFHLLKIRLSIDIFKNEKCKVTFGLEYINCTMDDVRVLFSGMPHGTTPAAVTTNNTVLSHAYNAQIKSQQFLVLNKQIVLFTI